MWQCSGSSELQDLSCESSGVPNILHPHRNEIALNAKIKMAPGPPWTQNRAGPWASGSLGLGLPRYRMSLWEFECSQRCTVMATTEFSQQVFSTLQRSIWFEMGGPLNFQNDTQEFSCVSNNLNGRNPYTRIPGN